MLSRFKRITARWLLDGEHGTEMSDNLVAITLFMVPTWGFDAFIVPAQAMAFARRMPPIATSNFPVSAQRPILGGNMAHRNFRILSVLAALWATALSAVAHHGSNVSYHTDQTMTIAGIVTEWEFINPHPQIYFDVKTETGEIEHWAAELLPTPSMMKNMKVGWSRTTINPGDQILLVCNPPRAAGAKACLAKELKVNGKDWPVAPGGGGASGAAKGKQ